MGHALGQQYGAQAHIRPQRYQPDFYSNLLFDIREFEISFQEQCLYQQNLQVIQSHTMCILITTC